MVDIMYTSEEIVDAHSNFLESRFTAISNRLENKRFEVYERAADTHRPIFIVIDPEKNEQQRFGLDADIQTGYVAWKLIPEGEDVIDVDGYRDREFAEVTDQLCKRIEGCFS